MFMAFLMSPLLSRTRAAKQLSLTSSLVRLWKKKHKKPEKKITKRKGGENRQQTDSFILTLELL